MLESAVEAKLARLVKARRGLTFKLAPTVRGLPDRLVVLPGGRIFLVELKQARGALSPAQVLLHARLMAIGVEVVTLYGPDDVVQWLKGIS